MATTINAYSVSLAMDASSYIKKNVLVKKETQQLARIINQSRGPMDKYERSLNALDNAYGKGAIKVEVYGRLLDDLNRRFKKGKYAVDQKASALDKVTGFMKGQVKVLAGMAASWLAVGTAVNTVRGAYEELRETMLAVDKIAKTARGLGMSMEALQSFRLMAGESAGLDEGAMDAALQKMTLRVGQAVQGVGEAVKAFDMLGLSINEVFALTPEAQFARIADAIADMATPAERAAAAQKLFEEAGLRMLPFLEKGADGLREYKTLLRSLGQDMSTQAVTNIETFNDELGRSELALDGVKRQLLDFPLVTEAMVLAIRRVNDELRRVLILMKGFKAAANFLTTGSFFKRDEAFYGRQSDQLAAKRLKEAGLDPNLGNVMRGMLQGRIKPPAAEGITEGERMSVVANLDRIRDEKRKRDIEQAAKANATNTKLMMQAGDAIGNVFGKLVGAAGSTAARALDTTPEILENTAKAIDANSNEAHQFMLEAQKRAAEQKAEEKQRAERAAKQRDLQTKAINKLVDTFGLQGWGAV